MASNSSILDSASSVVTKSNGSSSQSKSQPCHIASSSSSITQNQENSKNEENKLDSKSTLQSFSEGMGHCEILELKESQQKILETMSDEMKLKITNKTEFQVIELKLLVSRKQN